MIVAFRNAAGRPSDLVQRLRESAREEHGEKDADRARHQCGSYEERSHGLLEHLMGGASSRAMLHHQLLERRLPEPKHPDGDHHDSGRRHHQTGECDPSRDPAQKAAPPHPGDSFTER